MSEAPPTVVTIGYQLRDLEEVIGMLRAEAVDVLVDVRLNARSREPGFSKSALAASLAEGGIEYRHEPTLGNPPDNREPFQRWSTRSVSTDRTWQPSSCRTSAAPGTASRAIAAAPPPRLCHTPSAPCVVDTPRRSPRWSASCTPPTGSWA